MTDEIKANSTQLQGGDLALWRRTVAQIQLLQAQINATLAVVEPHLKERYELSDMDKIDSEGRIIRATPVVPAQAEVKE